MVVRGAVSGCSRLCRGRLMIRRLGGGWPSVRSITVEVVVVVVMASVRIVTLVFGMVVEEVVMSFACAVPRY